MSQRAKKPNIPVSLEYRVSRIEHGEYKIISVLNFNIVLCKHIYYYRSVYLIIKYYYYYYVKRKLIENFNNNKILFINIFDLPGCVSVKF